MRNILRTIVASALLAVVSQTAMAQQCQLPQKSMNVAELMFGRNIGERFAVTEKRWSQFLAKEITPRFPNGLSVVDASGQWLDADTKRIVHERSKLVMIVLDGSAEAQQKLDEIVIAYKSRFRQQAVGVIVR